ncbi:MAG: transporter substrate-binding domain-containing protein [Candidatus Aminicenantes bacterium]|nr:transporter substrate-binding domain-containing protein [Candidatus Aminicenantes bacterium]
MSDQSQGILNKQRAKSRRGDKPAYIWRRPRHTRLILLLTASLLWINHFSSGAPPVIRVGVYQNEPKIYLDKLGNPAGIFVELLNEMSLKEGWKLDYVPYNWEECIEALQDQRIDLLPDVAFSPQRNETLDFNKIPVFQSWSQVYTRPGATMERFADLCGKRVALLKSSIQEERFDQLMRGFGFSFSKLPVPSFSEAFILVQEGVADAAIVNVFFGSENYARHGLKPNPVLINPVSLYFATKKGANRQLLAAIDNHLDKWIRTPHSFYYQQLGGYMGDYAQQVSSGPFKWLLVLAGIMLLSALGLILVLIRKAVAASRNLKAVNRQLREEESRFRSYVEHSPYAIFCADENGNYTDVNPAAEFITGYSRQELLGKNILDLIPAKTRGEAGNHFSRVLTRQKASGILPFINKNGEERYWSVNATKISRDINLAFVSDVTDHFRMEQKLMRMKDQLEQEVAEKTRELQDRIAELEHFHDVTIERELRMNELRDRIRLLEKKKT